MQQSQFRVYLILLFLTFNFNLAYAKPNSYLPSLIIVNQQHITQPEIWQRWRFLLNTSKISHHKNNQIIAIWQEKLLEKIHQKLSEINSNMLKVFWIVAIFAFLYFSLMLYLLNK